MADTEPLAADQTEELRRMAQRAINVTGSSVNSFAAKTGLPPGAFSAFLRGDRGISNSSTKALLRRLAKLATKTPGILPERALPSEPSPKSPPEDRPDMPVSAFPDPGELPPGDDDVPTSVRVTGPKDSMSDADHNWLVAVIQRHQGSGSVAELNRRLGLGPTALHGVIRGACHMSGSMANRLLQKLGEPTRFVRSVSPPAPRKKPAKKATPQARALAAAPKEFRISANKAARLRTLMKRTIKADHKGNATAFARSVGLTGAQITAVLGGRGLLQSTYLKILAGLPDTSTAMTVRASAPAPIAKHRHEPGHDHAHGHAPVKATLPTAVLELAEGRAQTPVAKAARAMVARWKQEAFAFVLRYAEKAEDEG
jgi:hypothetical protein